MYLLAANNALADDYHLYQSYASLPQSTASASSGYFITPAKPINMDDAANEFRQQYPQVNTDNRDTPLVDELGRIDIEVFKRTYPVVGGMLPHFIVMTCLLLYFGPMIQSWPNSEALEALALMAIDIILGAHAIDGAEAAEKCKLSIQLLTYK